MLANSFAEVGCAVLALHVLQIAGVESFGLFGFVVDLVFDIHQVLEGLEEEDSSGDRAATLLEVVAKLSLILGDFVEFVLDEVHPKSLKI